MLRTRYIELTAEGMQRLGHVKALVSISSPTMLRNFQGINKELSKLLRRRVPLGELTEAAHKYFGTRKRARVEDGQLELQDAYLSDAGLPSQTGGLTNKAFEDGYVSHLAVALGLLRRDNYSLTPLGEVLQQLMEEGECSAFKHHPGLRNPYFLTTSQKIFFLFCFLSNDGDIIRRMYPKLVSSKVEFHRAWAGVRLAEAFREMASELRGTAKTIADYNTIRRLQECSQMMENQPVSSHSGVREQRVTLRLEAFVDLSWLQKDHLSKYSYRITDAASCFVSRMVEIKDVGELLDNRFFELANKCYGLGARACESSDEIIERVVPSYQRLRSGLGYAPLMEMLLLANLLALEQGLGQFFELSAGREAVKLWQKDHADDIRFSVDKKGDIRYVKLSGSLVDKMG